MVRGVDGELIPIRHGWSEGLTSAELFSRVIGARWGLTNTISEMSEMTQGLAQRSAPPGYNVLARARRADQPGIVFARAAFKKEVDPLVDGYSRFFVGV